MARTLNHEVSILKFAPNGDDNDIKDVFARDLVCEDVESGDTASKAYAAGAFLIWKDRKLYQTKSAIASGATLSNAANGNLEAVGPLSNLKNALSNEVTTRTKVSTHNLLRTRDDNDTWRGVTFTKNSDKTFTLSGQITTSPSIWECANITGAELELLKGAPLIISGSISNTSRMNIAAKDASGTYVLDENVYTDEKTITIPNSAVELSVYFVVNETAGTTVSGTYKPMLRWATDSNSEYSPYVPTNSQLLSYKDNGVLGAKNFLSLNPQTLTIGSTVTAVVNNDGTITVNGEYSSSSNTFGNVQDLSLPAGTYKISDKSVSADCIMQIFNATTQTVYWYNDTTFTYNGTDTLRFRLWIRGNSSFTNLRMYPMLLLPSDTDPTYQPYAMTNKELTENATPSSTSVSVPSTYSAGTSYLIFEKVNGIATLQWSGSAPSLPEQGVEYEIATIPTGYVPRNTVLAHFVDFNSFTKGIYISLRSGKVYLFGYNTGTNGLANCAPRVTYIV